MNRIPDIRRNNFLKLSKRYKNQREFADVLDVTSGYVNQLLTGHRSIGEKTARKFEKILGLPNLFLDMPSNTNFNEEKISLNAPIKKTLGRFAVWDSGTPLESDEVELPFLKEVEASAITGRCSVQENHGMNLRFSKTSLLNWGINPAHAVCAKVSGNSMEPAIPDGSTIGIDTTKKEVINGDIYAIDHEGQLRIKIVYKIPGGGIRLRSFNQEEWPDELYPAYDSEKIKILGRVFWWSVLR